MGTPCFGKSVKHVISVRVNDAELEILQELAQSLSVNISKLLRQGLNLVIEEEKGHNRTMLRKKL